MAKLDWWWGVDDWFDMSYSPKITKEFADWWRSFYGSWIEYEDSGEYLLRMAFAFDGWQAMENKSGLSLKDKALQCIDWICLVEEREGDKEMDMIARFAHAAFDYCPNPHIAWKQELVKFFDDLVEQGELRVETKEEHIKRINDLAFALHSLPRM
jgi:hypothetical protein